MNTDKHSNSTYNNYEQLVKERNDLLALAEVVAKKEKFKKLGLSTRYEHDEICFRLTRLGYEI